MLEMLQRLYTWHIMQSDYEEAWDKMIQTYKIKGLFGYHLFCWNWKLITESIVDKGKI